MFVKDLGPWDKYPTVTNTVEVVVAELWESGKLGPGERLIYEDSLGALTEVIVNDKGQFKGFNAVPAFYRGFYVG